MRQLFPTLLLATALLATAGSASGAPKSGAMAKERVAEAEELARGGRFDAAEEILRSTLRRCRDVDDACAIRVATSLGWLAGRRAEADPKSAQSWRETSLAYYHRAHRLRPDHPRLRANLVLALQAAGRPGDAVKLWRGAAESGSAKDLTLLGDLYRQAGDIDAARRVYFRVEKQQPGDDELHRRLLQTYRLRPGNPTQHREWCERLWKQGRHALAAQGLQRLLATPGHPYAEWALLHWADQKVRAGGLSDDDLASLRAHLPPGELPEAALEGLDHLALDLDPDRATWWTATPLRRHVSARILRYRAASLEGAGQDDDAVSALEAARSVAPRPDEYSSVDELDSRKPVWIDATADLAALYRRTGRDPDFAGLESELFEGKIRSYLDSDLESIHRFHTILGLIYAEEGRWRGGRFANALFQLHRALETSGLLAEQRKQPAPPLPHLRMRYARGLQETGDATAAQATYRRAAMEYLQLDDVRTSLDAVAAAQRLGPDRSLRGIETIARTRLALAGGAVEIGDGWLASTKSIGLPDDFVQGQRFKVYSDLASIAESAGEDEKATELRMYALSVAPDEDRLLRADALRIEELGSKIDIQRLAVDEERLLKKLDGATLRQNSRIDG